MGQYHLTVNLDKREFVDPHKLGAGLKLWEQLANENGPGKALIVLLAHPDQRGGGDFDIDANWHGPERKDFSEVGEMPEQYPAIAKRTVGRWRGDRIAIIGDYAEDGDIENLKPTDPPLSAVYGLCRSDGDDPADFSDELKEVVAKFGTFKDVTADVCKVIEHELNGRYIGDGWRNFVSEGSKVSRWEGPGHARVEGTVKEVKEKLITVDWPTGQKKYHGDSPKVDFF